MAIKTQRALPWAAGKDRRARSGFPQETELEDTREDKNVSVPSFCSVMRICFVTVCFFKKIGCIYQAQNHYQIKNIFLCKKRKLSLTRIGTQRTWHHTPEVLLKFQILWDFSVLPWSLRHIFILGRDRRQSISVWASFPSKSLPTCLSVQYFFNQSFLVVTILTPISEAPEWRTPCISPFPRCYVLVTASDYAVCILILFKG